MKSSPRWQASRWYFLLRVLALRLDIRTRPLGAFPEHWRVAGDDAE